MKTRLLSLPLTLLVTSVCAAPHQHGTAHFDMVLEPPTLLMSISSPLANLVGFEHRPQTPEQEARLLALQQQMQKPETLVTLPAAADCSLSRVLLQNPFPDNSHNHDHAHTADEHSHEHHAELMAEYHYVCARPEHLDQVELPLIQLYPGIEQLRFQFIAADRQHRVDLQAPQNSIRLP